MKYLILFINNIPLFYPTKCIGRQGMVELWLDPGPYLEALNLNKLTNVKQKLEYVI